MDGAPTMMEKPNINRLHKRILANPDAETTLTDKDGKAMKVGQVLASRKEQIQESNEKVKRKAKKTDRLRTIVLAVGVPVAIIVNCPIMASVVMPIFLDGKTELMGLFYTLIAICVVLWAAVIALTVLLTLRKKRDFEEELTKCIGDLAPFYPAGSSEGTYAKMKFDDFTLLLLEAQTFDAAEKVGGINADALSQMQEVLRSFGMGGMSALGGLTQTIIINNAPKQEAQEQPKAVELKVGDVVEGKVVHVSADLGAFVELEGGKAGFISISRLPSYVSKLEGFLNVGDMVKAEIDSLGEETIDLNLISKI